MVYNGIQQWTWNHDQLPRKHTQPPQITALCRKCKASTASHSHFHNSSRTLLHCSLRESLSPPSFDNGQRGDIFHSLFAPSPFLFPSAVIIRLPSPKLMIFPLFTSVIACVIRWQSATLSRTLFHINRINFARFTLEQ